MSKFVKFHDLDSTRIITIDKPETKNALTSEMLSTISEIIRNSEELTQIRSIIITSNCEKIFSSGYDISSKNLDNKEDLLKIHVIGYQKEKHPLMEASETIRDSSKIIIAAINGHIFGGTLEVLLNCDFKFLSKECYFCMPPAKLGIAYNYNGIKNFINKIGVVNTKKIFLTADKFNSSEALNMGLVDFLSSHDEVITDSIELGKKISQNAPLSLASIKKSINSFEDSQKLSKEEHKKIRESVERAIESSDYEEAQDAFKEKRKPLFKGE